MIKYIKMSSNQPSSHSTNETPGDSNKSQQQPLQHPKIGGGIGGIKTKKKQSAFRPVNNAVKKGLGGGQPRKRPTADSSLPNSAGHPLHTTAKSTTTNTTITESQQQQQQQQQQSQQRQQLNSTENSGDNTIDEFEQEHEFDAFIGDHNIDDPVSESLPTVSQTPPDENQDIHHRSSTIDSAVDTTIKDERTATISTADNENQSASNDRANGHESIRPQPHPPQTLPLVADDMNKTRILDRNQRQRTRPVSLARLDAARKRRKGKVTGVAINGTKAGETSMIKLSNNDTDQHPNHMDTRTILKNDDDDNIFHGSNGNRSATKFEEKILKEDTQESMSSNNKKVDLSHHPILQSPLIVLPENKSGMPALASFCSAFKVPKIKKGADQEVSSEGKTNTTTGSTIGTNTNGRLTQQPRPSTQNSNNATRDNNNQTNSDSQSKGPAVKIINGEIVLEEISLDYYENNNDTNRNNEEYDVIVEEENQIGLINTSYTSYLPEHKQRRSNNWTDSETLLFYRALRQVGTDFGTMESFFNTPNNDDNDNNNGEDGAKLALRSRTRKQLKRKYQMELAKNPELIEKAMEPIAKIDIDLSVFQLTEDAIRQVEAQRAKDKKEREAAAAAAALIVSAARVKALEDATNDEMEVIEEDEPIMLDQHHNKKRTRAATVSDQTWSIFEDEEPPDLDGQQENPTEEDQAFNKDQGDADPIYDDAEEYYENPFLVDEDLDENDNTTSDRDGNEAGTITTTKEDSPSSPPATTTIGLVSVMPTLGNHLNQNKKKKIKPKFLTKLK